MKLTFLTFKGDKFETDMPKETTFEEIADNLSRELRVRSNEIFFYYKSYLQKSEQTVDNIDDPEVPIFIRIKRREMCEKPVQSKFTSKPTPKSSPKPEPRSPPKFTQSSPKPEPPHRDSTPLDELLEMGFDRNMVIRALEAAGQNKERALNYLLNNSIPQPKVKEPTYKELSESVSGDLSPSELDFCRTLVTGDLGLDIVKQIFIANGKSEELTRAQMKEFL